MTQKLQKMYKCPFFISNSGQPFVIYVQLHFIRFLQPALNKTIKKSSGFVDKD